jgi:uncharacterized protein
MGPLLRLVLIVFGLWLVIRIIKRALADTSTPRHPPSDNTRHNDVMLRCAHCGVYIPQSEAYQRMGSTYCSREHAEADKKT